MSDVHAPRSTLELVAAAPRATGPPDGADLFAWMHGDLAGATHE